MSPSGIVERQRLMEGDVEPAWPASSAAAPSDDTDRSPGGGGWPAFLSGLGLVAAGALVGLIASVMRCSGTG